MEKSEYHFFNMFCACVILEIYMRVWYTWVLYRALTTSTGFGAVLVMADQARGRWSPEQSSSYFGNRTSNALPSTWSSNRSTAMMIPLSLFIREKSNLRERMVPLEPTTTWTKINKLFYGALDEGSLSAAGFTLTVIFTQTANRRN